jgi:hypothetical protein
VCTESKFIIITTSWKLVIPSLIQISKAKGSPKCQKKNPGTQANGKFNDISSVGENK